MAFPSISLKSTNIELTPDQRALVDEKLSHLDKFLPEGETDVRCDVEVEKIAEHQSGKIYRVEVNLFIAGKLYRAEATEEQVEKAIDVVRNEVKREVKRAHNKAQSLFRRGGQKIKEMLRFERE
ncbi:ribosome-associated translation inhibitor RaiA [Candidatus Kaiserbacteria bacterium]|nr:ribosome-associated translation inhibitor RaiA [Candidatus Kaiserbacteria bacterium]